MKDIDFNFKRITDPVHGTIGLSELESKIINVKPFQRLRNIKHLGLAHLVFPGSDFSRFSHSIGVCSTTGLILQSLRDYFGEKIDDKEIQEYRLAALLHDIGHYPFSHAMEKAIKNYYAGTFITKKNTKRTKSSEENEEFFDHERLGKEIIISDPELNQILNKYKIKPDSIYSVFMREKPLKFVNIISSDLDADRLDYLLRMAHHTGMPYGNVDINYLLSQIKLDKDNRLCISSKSIRTADHLLLSRYFAYQQVVYHKTVFIFEHILNELIGELFKKNKINGSKKWVTKAVLNQQEWLEFDDSFVTNKIRELYKSSRDNILKAKINSVLNRNPPKLVAEYEALEARESKSEFRSKKSYLLDKINKWSRDFNIDKRLWYCLDIPGMPLTKIGSHLNVSSLEENHSEEKDKYEQSIRVLNDLDNTSKPIMEMPQSLMKVLSDNSLYTLRLYVLFPENMASNEKSSKSSQIRKKIQSDLPDIQWK